MKKLILPLIFFIGITDAFSQVPTDTADLRSKINTWIVTNGTKQITATQVNQLFNGVANLMKAYAVDSAYRIADTLFLVRRGGFATIKITLNTGGAPSETDPTVPSVAKALSGSDTARWNSKQDGLTAGTGISIVANVISAGTTTAQWNANKLQGNNISITSPSTGQVLKWNGSTWAPANDSLGTGGTALINASGAGDTLFVASNKIKRIDHDATLIISTNSNKLLMGADTISYVASISKLRDTAAALRAIIGSGGSGTVAQVNSGYGLTGGPITSTGTLKVDTTGANGITTRSEMKDSTTRLKKSISDSLIYALKSILIPSRLEFIATSDTATYQDSALIGSQIMMLSIESYQVGFTTRSTSVYMAFDATTGTISLTNGQFTAGDQVIVIYRTPPVFLLDSSGNPIRDSSGNFIILN